MKEAIAHRGRVSRVRERRRLRARRPPPLIIDVEGGHQRFSDERGRISPAHNGEIYNHDHVRASLQARGHRFRSRCDKEVPHLYEKHRPDLTEHLRGMFVPAVWH